jgi:hypothetical protein
VKGEPIHKRSLKGRVGWILSVSWRFMLQPCPCSFVGTYALLSRTLVSKGS